MVINYQDKNIIIMYIQIFLKEHFNYTVHKVTPRRKSLASYYEITNNDPLKVTGYHNLQTYSALALYMAYTYPNEGYPVLWKRVTDNSNNTNLWVSEDFYYNGSNDDELLNVIISNLENSLNYKGTVQIPERVLSYIFNEVVTENSTDDEILRIKKLIGDNLNYKEALKYTEEFSDQVKQIQQSLIDQYSVYAESSVQKEVLFSNNIYYFQLDKHLRNAYIKKTDEELNYENKTGLTLYKSIYNPDTGVLSFDNKNGAYNLKVGETRDVVLKTLVQTELPQQFENFKVTGYVDPWTEVVIKGGVDLD